MKAILSEIIAIENLGELTSFQPLSGGCINTVYLVETSTQKVVIKLNDSPFENWFQAEFNGIQTLSSYVSTPKAKSYGKIKQLQYLILEFIQEGNGSKDFFSLGKALASQHQVSTEGFGWKEDNFIGSLEQLNTKCEDGIEFYINCRFEPLLKKSLDNHIITTAEVKKFERIYGKLNELIPQESPSLLHGDLWGGNVLFSKSGKGYFIDPAVYNGYRETDIAMTFLFGGFEPEFYQGYEEVYPLEQGWQSRIELHQLYPLLVHTVLFGGSYWNSVSRILDKYR